MTTQMSVLFNLVSLMFKPSIIGFEANVAVKEQSLQENVEVQYNTKVGYLMTLSLFILVKIDSLKIFKFNSSEHIKSKS